MYRRIGDATEALFWWIVSRRARIGESDKTLQRLAVVGKLLEYFLDLASFLIDPVNDVFVFVRKTKVAVMFESCCDDGFVVR